MIEELFRNRIGFGDVRHLRHFAGLKSGQMDHGLETVLSFLREHNVLLLRSRAHSIDEPTGVLGLVIGLANPSSAARTPRESPDRQTVITRSQRNAHSLSSI